MMETKVTATANLAFEFQNLLVTMPDRAGTPKDLSNPAERTERNRRPMAQQSTASTAPKMRGFASRIED